MAECLQLSKRQTRNKKLATDSEDELLSGARAVEQDDAVGQLRAAGSRPLQVGQVQAHGQQRVDADAAGDQHHVGHFPARRRSVVEKVAVVEEEVAAYADLEDVARPATAVKPVRRRPLFRSHIGVFFY